MSEPQDDYAVRCFYAVVVGLLSGRAYSFWISLLVALSVILTAEYGIPLFRRIIR